ncbi:MAG TPA: transposase [Chloroflexota bacterium]|nr:transposase [Chloroflexota bacterium]
MEEAIDEDGHRVVLVEIVQITEKESNTMADELRMARDGLLRKVQIEDGADFLRDGGKVLSQALMELEVSQQLGVERYERSPERMGQRNGYWDRTWDTRVGIS